MIDLTGHGRHSPSKPMHDLDRGVVLLRVVFGYYSGCIIKLFGWFCADRNYM